MNTREPHEIVPMEELTPLARATFYVALTKKEERRCRHMTREQRGAWILKHIPQRERLAGSGSV